MPIRSADWQLTEKYDDALEYSARAKRAAATLNQTGVDVNKIVGRCTQTTGDVYSRTGRFPPRLYGGDLGLPSGSTCLGWAATRGSQSSPWDDPLAGFLPREAKVDVAQALVSLASSHINLSESAEALACLNPAGHGFAALGIRDGLPFAEFLGNTGDAQVAAGQFGAGFRTSQRALAMFGKSFHGDSHPSITLILENIAIAEGRLG